MESRSAAAKVSVASSPVPVVATGTSGDRCAVISGSSVYTQHREGPWRGGGSVRNKKIYYKHPSSRPDNDLLD